ncbi:MAG TPA: DUF2076 domain-containing protein [Xanthobacteraceae bacterium]
MTPQENQLVAELFDRLASLERSPRDPDAERAIIEGLRRAPNAAYALVQTVLVQDEALKRANAQIEELAAKLADGAQREAPREAPHGFLDSMRDALTGRDAPAGHDERRGSVPSVRPGGLGTSGVWGAGANSGAGVPPAGQPMMGQQMSGPAGFGGTGFGGTGFGGGSSFLGTAAASAAGVIGGAMLLNGIRSMFGHQAGGASAFDPGSAAASSPWGGSAANSDLARQAGVDNIGGAGSGAAGAGDRQAGLLGGSDQDDQDDRDDQDAGDTDDDTDLGGDFGSGDSDLA